jgi:hypothetical protein
MSPHTFHVPLYNNSPLSNQINITVQLSHVISSFTRINLNKSSIFPKIFWMTAQSFRILQSLLSTCLTLVSCETYPSNLKMEATRFSETSVNFQRTTRCYIPEDRTLHIHHCENIKYSTILDLGTRWRWVVSFTLRSYYSPVSIGQETGWAPEPVSTIWKREKSLAPAESLTPAVQPVARR